MGRLYLLSLAILCFVLFSCSKDCFHHRPKAGFTYVVTNPGELPANVNFISASSNATSYEWWFGDGTTFETTEKTINHLYPTAGTYTVQLVAIGRWGTDTAWQNVPITAN